MLTAADVLASRAAQQSCAVAAFNVITLEHAEAIVGAAERARLPVVVAVSHNAVRFHGALRPLAAACRELADASSVPVGLHLDHVEDLDLVGIGADAGFGSVMYDASMLSYDDNVAATRAAAELLHDRGLWLEAELGEVGGKDGAHAPGARTDPDEAAAYVAATGVDALAVAVGTSHAMTERTAKLDLPLVSRLATTAGVPLVLHGSSGVPDEQLGAAVMAGMRKINVGTQLNIAYTDAVRRGLASQQGPDPRPWLRAARDSMSSTVERLLRLLATPRS